MAQPFETELEELATKFARNLAQEVTALILRRLGIDKASTRSGTGAVKLAAVAGGRAAKPKRVSKSESSPAQPSRRSRATVEERAASLDKIERIVSTSEGLSAGEIERRSGLSRAAVAGALKALKDDGRLFMGGTKRFARYSTTQAAADKASREARGGGAEE